MTKKCKRCGQGLGRQYIRAGEALFHPSCFTCKHCRQAIQGDYAEHKGWAYHPACSPRRKQPSSPPAAPSPTEPSTPLICRICQQPITGKYRYNHWGEQVHTEHQGHPSHACSVCARFLSVHTQHGIQHADGRVVCGLCQVTAVETPASVQGSRQRVLAHLQQAGFGYIPDYLAIVLSDQKRLNQMLGKSQHTNSQGLTKTLEKTVDGVLAYREHRIFILTGLPRLLFEGVLAHELLHVWLNEHPETRQRSPQEIEGFCNLGTALIYEDNTPLAHYLLQRMHESADPIYGEGFRQQHQRLQQLGWVGLRQEMLRPAPALKQTFQKVDRWLNKFGL